MMQSVEFCNVKKKGMETKTFIVKWMSFVIFKLCKCEERANFLKLERAFTRLVSVKSHLRFNETCFNTSSLPVYTNVRTHDEAARNETFTKDFRLKLLERQIDKQKKRDFRNAHRC